MITLKGLALSAMMISTDGQQCIPFTFQEATSNQTINITSWIETYIAKQKLFPTKQFQLHIVFIQPSEEKSSSLFKYS